jgi:hypothetical protein
LRRPHISHRQKKPIYHNRSKDIKQPLSLSSVEDEPENENSHPVSLAPLEWPPQGFTSEDELPEQEAKASITAGVPEYSGHRVPIPHASEDYFALYATSKGATGDDNRARFHMPAFSAMTFQILGPGMAKWPWETLEQPSLAFCYGMLPGTITLNHWTSMPSRLKPTVSLRDPGVKPREVDLLTIIDRLIYLETNFEEDDEDLMYKNLYKVLLRDPDRFLNPHKAMEKQIADLIIVLSSPQWIDFSDPRHHLVAKYFAGANYAEEARYKKFFHQLLLSVELDVRINSKYHAELPKKKLLSQLPPCIAWDLALSRMWREGISIKNSKEHDGPEQSK